MIFTILLLIVLSVTIFLLKPRKIPFSNSDSFEIEVAQFNDKDVVVVKGLPFNALFNEFRFYCYEVREGEIEISLYSIIGFPFINKGIKEVRSPLLLKSDYFINRDTQLITLNKTNKRILLGKITKDKNKLILSECVERGRTR